MLHAIRKTGVRRVSAKVEVGLAWMTHRPLADAVVELEQACLVGDFRARLCGNEAAWRSRRDRRLLIAWSLADEATGANRAILDIL